MKNLFAIIFVLSALNSAIAQWIQSNAPNGYRIWGMAAKDTNLYAAVWTQGVYRSNDYGKTWSQKINGLNSTALQVKCIDITDSYVYTAGWGVNRSNDQGENWTEVNNGLISLYTYSLAHHDMYNYVGSSGGLVFYSSNDGDLWNSIPINATDRFINQLVVSDSLLFAGTDGDGIFRTNDNGAHWESVNNGLTNLWILSLEVSGTNLYAGTYFDSFYISNDGGANWVNSTGNLPLAPDNTVSTIAVDGSSIFVGLRSGVYVSQDQGTHWQAINEGLSNTSIMSLEVSGSNLLAGTDGSGIYYRPLSDIYNYLQIPDKDDVHGFGLSQNYPNPVNSDAAICFTIPYRIEATLTVFDQSGNTVSLLADGVFDAGRHKEFFDGNMLSNGVYYYRFTAGPFIQTRKIVLIK